VSETWNQVLDAFAPLLLGVGVLGGGCVVVALLARSVMRRAAATNADPSSEPVVRARRTFAVATTLATTLGVLAVALPVAAVVPKGWLGALVLLVGLAVVLWVVRKMWPVFGEKFVPAPPKKTASPKRPRFERPREGKPGRERAGSGRTRGAGKAGGRSTSSRKRPKKS
jgi:hypothetical protein